MRDSFTTFVFQQQRIRRLTDFLGTQLDNERLCLADMADIACLSPSQTLRFYRQRTGETPMHALQRLRLQRAHDTLMQQPDTPIIALALEAGYDSHAAFTRAYCRAFRHPPTRTPGREQAPVRWHLVRLPERKVWQFDYEGDYAGNAYFKARLAWLCLAAGGRFWRGWRSNDRDHPFDEHSGRKVRLCHFVPLSRQERVLGEADLATHLGGLFAMAHINPADRSAQLSRLCAWLASQTRCSRREAPILEEDLNLRDHRAPQDRRIAIYVPVALTRPPSPLAR
ncbi:MAG: helix-turn-helix domain-containing protein [Candidatus Dactylopiibacterium sp.]|nr:helix-turn-helix domain-containing protein [Candidatus Dactylopiibacterium sp.]